MRNQRWAGLAVVLICILLASSLQGQTTFKDDLKFRGTQMPHELESMAWVSGRSGILESGGQFRGRAFPWFRGREFKGLPIPEAMVSPPDGCWNPATSSFVDIGSTARSVTQIVRDAKQILTGVVTGIDGGFYGGGFYTGLLVRVEVSDWIKPPEGRPTPSVVYFFYPAGDFYLGLLKVCLRPGGGWPEHPPAVGERVLLFPQHFVTREEVEDSAFILITGEGKELAFTAPNGMEVSPGLLDIQEFRGTSFDDLAGRMSRIQARQEAQR